MKIVLNAPDDKLPDFDPKDLDEGEVVGASFCPRHKMGVVIVRMNVSEPAVIDCVLRQITQHAQALIQKAVEEGELEIIKVDTVHLEKPDESPPEYKH